MEKDRSAAVRRIIARAEEHHCNGIVVGLPVHQQNLPLPGPRRKQPSQKEQRRRATRPKGELGKEHTDNRTGRACRNFARELARAAQPHSITVWVVDESWSTFQAVENHFLAPRKRKHELVCHRSGACAASLAVSDPFDQAPVCQCSL